MGLFGLVGRVLLIVVWCDNTLSNKMDSSLRIKWVPKQNFNPENHEVAGAINKNWIFFICRDHRDGGQYLGFMQKGASCTVLVNGKREYAGPSGEVLWYPKGTLSWAPMPDKYNPPPNLFLAGFDGKDGEALYVCRGAFKTRTAYLIMPGNYKFNRKENKCEVDINGSPVLLDIFEMLYLSFYGISAKAAAD